MLNIIYGQDSSNRDELAYNRIKQRAEANATTWILVPEQFSMSTEKDILKRFGISAQAHIKVITFSRLCNLVLGYCGPLRMKYIDGAGKEIIAARTIRVLRGKLGSLGSNFKRKGFSATIVDLVSEFKRYGISGDMLSSAAENSQNPDLAEKLRDISVIYKTFEDFLEAHLADAEDNLSLIIPKLSECDFLRGELFIMHFRSFTPVEYRAIGELMKIADVCAVMCCDGIDKPSPLFSPIGATCRKLSETAENSGAFCNEPVKATGSAGNPEINYLTENYFASRPKPQSMPPECVHVVEALNQYREVEAAADLIIRLCRTENRRFSDFLVLARNTVDYNRIMPGIFESRGIDVFLDTRRSILTKALTIYISSALDILSFGYSYERVMSIAKTGLCNLSDLETDMFENYLLAVNPSHAMWAEEEWSYCPKGYDMEVINSARAKITSFTEGLSRLIEGRKTAGDICRAILKTLEELQLLEEIKSLRDNFEEAGNKYLAEEYRQVWNSIVSVLSQIMTLMDEENITWKDFAELFRSSCSGITIGMTPQNQGSVIFSQIDKFRSSNTPVVIVLGMTEGVFPLSHTAEGILSDAERRELLKMGIQLAPGAETKQKEEQLLIYSVLTAAREKLYLFYPQSSNSGKPLEPSPVIKTITSRIFPNITVQNPDTDGDILKGGEGRAAAFEVLCTYLAKAEGNVDRLTSGVMELYNYFINHPDYKKRLEYITEAMTSKEPTKISKGAVEAIYGKTIMISASKLEKYNACAFSYFMSYGLLAEEREKAGIEPRSTGSIQHAALCKYFTRLKDSNCDYTEITKESCYRDVYDIVKAEATGGTELLYESSSYYKYVVTRMQGIAARTAWEVVKFYRSSLFRPMGFEIEIKNQGEIPELAIKDNQDNTIASLRGIIDRADVAQINGKTYISVIDYKSSEKTLDERLAEAGVNIQPLLYSDIICRRMNASPAAMLYMQMTDPIVEESKLKGVTDAEIEKASNKGVLLGGWLNDDAGVVSGYSRGGENGEVFTPSGRAALIGEAELNRRINLANNKIREAAMGIYNGNVAAEPYIDKNYDACRYCIFGGVCGNRKDE